MKKLICIFLLLLMTACYSGELNGDLDSVFNNIDNITTYDSNNALKYYSYYLPSSFSEKETTSDSISLAYGNSTIIMNLNVSDIINQKYYTDSVLSDEGFYNEDYLIYKKEGTYTCSDESIKQYLYKLYDYDTYYALYLKTSDNVFYGNILKGDEKEVTRQLFALAKSVSVDSELVIADYSSKDTIDYQKKQLDLFNFQKPESGTLSEMLTDDATVGDGSNIEDENQEETSDVQDEPSNNITQEEAN